METGKLDVDAVKFFVLDEADRLLDTGNLDVILKMFHRFPKASSGTHRLQASPPLISHTCTACCILYTNALGTSRQENICFLSAFGLIACFEDWSGPQMQPLL